MFKQILGAAIIGAVIAAPANAGDFSFSISGHGKDVIFVPGLGASAEVMKDVANAMEDVRWHLVSVPGFAGRAPSEKPGEDPLTVAAAAVSTYIAEQDLQCPILIGHSVGALVGIRIATDARQNVCGLVVMDAPPALGAVLAQDAKPETLQTLADSIARPLADFSPSQFADWANQMAESWGGRPATRESVAAMVAGSDQATVSRVFAQALTTDVTPLLGQITVPTLVVFTTPQGHGMTDEMIDSFYRTAYAGLTNGQFRHIPDAGHFLMLDQPAATAAAIADFLSTM
jgi:pimeloyl-ACP methyl ester carboxylesterase